MNREILKFRAWDGLNKKFTYWTLNDLCTWDTKDEKPSALDKWEQYTGLKDKNGVEIYCGDIVKVYYEDVIGDCEPIQRAYAFDWAGKIVYLQEDAMFAIVDKDEVFIDTLESEVGKSLIFLGNIHQNPELLNS